MTTEVYLYALFANCPCQIRVLLVCVQLLFYCNSAQLQLQSL